MNAAFAADVRAQYLLSALPMIIASSGPITPSDLMYPEYAGDLLFGTTDVTVHVYDTHADSWEPFDGDVVVESDPNDTPDGTLDIVVLSMIAMLTILGVVAYLLMRTRG